MIREGPHSGPFVVLWVEQSVEVNRGMQCLHTREVGDLLPVKMVFQDAGSLDFEVPVVPLGAGDPTEQHVKH